MTALLPLDLPPAAVSRGAEIIIDSFAGGGGASQGIYQALGRHPEVAINHDPEAVALHMANHPETDHYCQSVYSVDPREAAKGRPVGLLWASPDCKHFSKAKGGKPLSKGIRDLAWVVVHYAELVRPRVIILENVEEFQTWGPLDADGRPIKAQAGETFQQWVKALRRHGYRVEWRELRACDYGAPTIRKRLFVIARRDGQPITWPEPTHGALDSAEVLAGERRPWRTAAEIIDWSVPTRSIFGREKPLAEGTCGRIARGVVRYVIEAARPFIIPVTHSGDLRCWSTDEPLRTITSAKRGEMALVAPTIMRYRQHSIGQRVDAPLSTVTAGQSIDRLSTGCQHAVVAAHMLHLKGSGKRGGRAAPAPLATITSGGEHHGVVAAFLAKHYGGSYTGPGAPLDGPIHTVTACDHHALASVHLTHMHGRSTGREADAPAPTVATHAKAGIVAAFLTKYYGEGSQSQALTEALHTIPTRDRFGLVTVTIGGEPYVIADIGMRMLTPRELYRAQGFPDDYRIDIEVNGRPLSKAAQVRMCGNSVCPPLAEALARANVPDLAVALPAEAAE